VILAYAGSCRARLAGGYRCVVHPPPSAKNQLPDQCLRHCDCAANSLGESQNSGSTEYPRRTGLSLGVAADETDHGDSIEVHTFLLVLPVVSGTGKRVGAAPKSRSCFSGGTGTGEPEPEGCGSKAEASQTPGAARAPKQCRDNEQDRKRDQTDHHCAGRSRWRNAVVQNYPRYASAVLEVNDGFPERQLQMRGEETGTQAGRLTRQRGDAIRLRE
jgi:hypothetical protein